MIPEYSGAYVMYTYIIPAQYASEEIFKKTFQNEWMCLDFLRFEAINNCGMKHDQNNNNVYGVNLTASQCIFGSRK